MTETAPPLVQTVRPRGSWSGASDRLRLTYDARFLRRRRLVTEGGRAILLDLAETTNLLPGDALETADGQLIEVVAAEEPLLEVTGPDLARLAWHIGNRHAPCQIGPDRLFVRDDPVLADMLARLGARIRPVAAPFLPEGGAYGRGRTMGHDHGHYDHGHQDGGHHDHGHPEQPGHVHGAAEAAPHRHSHDIRADREHHFRRVEAHATHLATAEDVGPDADGPE